MESALKLGSASQSTALMALGLMAIIVMMVVPVPAFLLDIGLTFSFALAILIFTTTLFIERPLDFSSFPTVLLASLMLRLALNVSSTKLIIGQGHTGPDAAGSVIHGFAMFIMGGNIFLGLVVFGVLLIVNFMVITKGAGRMAEVGARFALDAMPGKQLAIDSDVAAGAITHEDAKARRKLEQDETTFFGSLDGASKFVKGDAVAGLLITMLNIVVGLAMGVGIHGLSVGDAVSTYSILTVGDGLVSQIPAVVISIASALLLSKGGVAGSTDRALIGQLGAQPTALATVGAIMAAFALMPGLPFLPFTIGAMSMFAAAFYLQKAQKRQAASPTDPMEIEPQKASEKPLGDILDVDEIHVELGSGLLNLTLDSVHGVEPRIKKIRRYIAQEFGFIIPPIRMTDNLDLPKQQYSIKIQGVLSATGIVHPDKLLVITDYPSTLPFEGEDSIEPVYGAQARWVDGKLRNDVASAGFTPIEPAEVISTHLLETIKTSFSQLVTRRAIQRIFEEYSNTSDIERSAKNARLIEEFVPEKISIEFVRAVFRLLLDEMISVKNLPIILEAIADGRDQFTSAEDVTEFVRQRIARNIIAALKQEDGSLPLIQLDLEWEDTFRRHEVSNSANRVDIALTPQEFNRLTSSIAEQIRRAAEQDLSPVVVTTAPRRRFIHTVLSAKKIKCPVLSYEEIDSYAQPLLIGVAS